MIRAEIEKELAIKKEAGKLSEDDFNLLSWFLGICKSGSQWDAFVNCKWIHNEKFWVRLWVPTEQLRTIWSCVTAEGLVKFEARK